MSEVSTITVERVGPYGIMANGVWFALGKSAGVLPSQFVTGQSYQVEHAPSKTGKQYINSVTGGALKPAPAALPPAPPVAAPAFTPPAASPPPTAPAVYAKGTTGKSPDTDLRISRLACLKAAVDFIGSPSENLTVSDALDVADQFVAWVYK